MSFQIVCYLCKSFAQKSCSYNIQLGYDTKFICSIECHIALKAYIDAQYKYNNAKIGNMLIYAYDKHNYLWTKRPLTQNLIHTLLKRVVEYYFTSTSCRLSSYNINQSQVLRIAVHYTSVQLGWKAFNKNKEFDKCWEIFSGDEWSQEDPFDSEYYSDDLP
jgi:hypothetical protein